jgi:hypothetical protein
MIINELPKVIDQFYPDNVIIIGDLLSVFVNGPQGQFKEGEYFIIYMINAGIKICIYIISYSKKRGGNSKRKNKN